MRLARFKLTLSPALRLAIGLALMSACLFVVLELVTGLVPDPGKAAARTRMAIADQIATRLIGQLENAAPADLSRLLDQVRAGDPEIVAITLRAADGQILAVTGNAAVSAPPTGDDRSTLTRVLVPIERNRATWGRLELAFTPVYPVTVAAWLMQPIALTLTGLCLVGSFFYYLYLRRALQFLDPSSAVPQRVRAAFDTLAEGVIVLDKDGRIVLANQRFRDMAPAGSPDIYGKAAAALPWLIESLPAGRTETPWVEAVRSQRTVENIDCVLTTASGGDERRFVVRANPISDAGGVRRGCIVTFDDVSSLHRSNERLTETLESLKLSQAKIQSQNTSLQRLADCDPLTDCLNRRAFFERLATMTRKASDQNQYLSVAMCDIDHFKRVNDRLGHAAGDQVLKATAELLRSMVRDDDLLCRMGGEEFCIVWNSLLPDQIEARAEHLRHSLENALPVLLGNGQSVNVTISVGVACEKASAMPAESLLERADQALYEAKRAGRNCVRRWAPDTHSNVATASRSMAERFDV